MNDVVIEVSNESGIAECHTSYLGNQHQNLQNKLKFKFEGNIPEGIAWLEYEIDGIKKYALMEQCEEGYQIDIKSCLLISDYVKVDIKITQEENPNGIPVFVSSPVSFEVVETINAKEEEPVEYPSWQESLSSKLAEFENAEKVRNKNETTRIASEDERITKENQRREQEITRETNEATRQSNESERVSSEITRNKNEETRIFNENQRIENEIKRNSNEETRISNETAREEYINNLKERVDSGEFNGECNFATFEINEDMELVMNKTKDDMLLDFAINNDGELEVIIK